MEKKQLRKVKHVGLERKVDNFGRIVVPFEYREQCGINPGDKVVVYPLNVGFLICSKGVDIDDFLK